MTFAFVIVALYTNAEGDISLWNEPANFLDPIFVFACAFGMYRNSRPAAVVILVYFIFSKLLIGISLGRLPGLFVSLVFLYFYAKAIQGTFAFHKLEKKENSDYRSAPRWYFLIGIPVGLIVVFSIMFGAMTTSGVFPSTEVLSGEDLPNKRTVSDQSSPYFAAQEAVGVSSENV